jgi:hypothetical protein
MRVRILVLALVAASAACGADRNPVAPTPPTEPTPAPPPPAPVTWSLSGLVSHEEDDEKTPVAGARVEVVEGPDTGRSIQTGEDGRYQLTGLREADIALRAGADGFEPQTRKFALTGNQTADFSLRRPAPPPPTPPTRKLTGTLIEGLSESLVSGATVAVDGLGVFTSTTEGTFQIDAPDPEQIRDLTISSAATVTRTTQLRVPGPDTRLTVIPRSFDLAAFDQMFRPGGGLQRWVSPPRLVLQTRVLQFTNVTAQEYMAADPVMSGEDVDLLIKDLKWGLPQMTDGRLQFAGDARETATSGTSVRVARPGEIVVARFEGLQAATGFWGYGRWASDGSGAIQGGIIMLDAAFDSSGSRFRRSLRVHELGHALGYSHVTVRASVMNASAQIEPNEFDLNAARIGFLRPPGNRTPDIDPDAFTTNLRTGVLIWSGDR